MGLEWGWWRDHQGSVGALRPVLTDWFEQHGHHGWAAWFRDQAPENDRLERLFAQGSWHRVLVGSLPLETPRTRLNGPWVECLHVVTVGTEADPTFEALAGVPALARVRDLVLHGLAYDGDGHQAEELVRVGHLAPFLRGLQSLWCGLGLESGEELETLVDLVELSTPLGLGSWRHPTLETLRTWTEVEPGDLWFPELLFLDLEGSGESAAAILSQLPSVKELEIDDVLGPVVARLRSEGHLPNLERVQIWGGPELEIPGVVVQRNGPHSRDGIRRTSPWVYDRAIRVQNAQ